MLGTAHMLRIMLMQKHKTYLTCEITWHVRVVQLYWQNSCNNIYHKDMDYFGYTMVNNPHKCDDDNNNNNNNKST